MLRRLFLTVTATALAAIALFGLTGTAGAETSQAAPKPVAELDSGYLLMNYNGLCMDIGSNAPGTVVGMTYCNYGLTSQYWYFYSDYSIENYNGLCMDIGSNAPGTKVGITYCHAGYTSQKWYLYSDYTIRNYNGLCMDLGSNAPGTPVVIATCQTGYTSQKWYLI